MMSNYYNQSVKPKKDLKAYHLIDENGYSMHKIFKSSNAYSAALKAASAGYEYIYLHSPETGKVYAYVGSRVPLETSNVTEEQENFTARYGMQYKPIVKSLGSQKVE